MAKNHIDYPETYNDKYTASDIEQVKRIIDWMNDSPNRTNRHLGRCIGVSDAYISTLISGKYTAAVTEVIAKIIPVIEDSVRDNGKGEFVETSIWYLINHACKRAKDGGGFSIVAGAPGVGKTKALENYKAVMPNTLYLCGSESTNSGTVFDDLMDAMGLKMGKHLTKSAKEKEIIYALKGTKRLIILDEADKCQRDTVDPLRTISDRTGCGVVLAGNVHLRNQVKGGDGRFDLIESRVVFWPQLMLKISIEDLRSLMRPYIRDEQLSAYANFDEITRYAYEVVDGSARKLLKNLMPLVLDVDAAARKTRDSKYIGISCSTLSDIAKKYMGIDHPPAIPRRASAV